MDIGAVSADVLADVSGMAFDRTLPREDRLARFVKRANNPMWGSKIITDILKNPIYTGNLVQGRRVKSYKVHQIEAVLEEEWVRVPEAIITHETFERVQALLLRDTRTAPKGREPHLFSGFLKCANCGKSVTRS